MRAALLTVVSAALVACAAPSAAEECAAPVLTLDKSDAAFAKAFAEGSKPLADTKTNFAAAFAAACANGLLKDKALPGGTGNPPWLYLLNAPNANVASIYTTDGGKPVKRKVIRSNEKAPSSKPNA